MIPNCEIDCVYVAASARDARFTRICVASIRYFYPDIPIRILVGGPLQPGLADELKKYWDVSLAAFPTGDYGWGFVKLEPLFERPGQKFLVLDSDTVMTGPVLDLLAGHDEDLIVDNEEHSAAHARAIYYDCTVAEAEGQPMQEAAFLFNTGQWFCNSGVLDREDFGGLIRWEFPRTLTNSRIFKNGEQGVFNYVANEQVRVRKIRVARVELMRWPAHSMEGLDAATISKRLARPLIIHWAGLKKRRQRDMIGSDVLAFFEKVYYEKMPFGTARRIMGGLRDSWSGWFRDSKARARNAARKFGIS